MDFKNSESICTIFSISSKSFYNVRNTNIEGIRTRNEGKKVFYNVDDFYQVLLKSKVKCNINYEDIKKKSIPETFEEKRGVNIPEINKNTNNGNDINGNSNNNDLYVKQLLSNIDDLKDEKKISREDNVKLTDKFENLVNELNDELKTESKKVEKLYFVSERYDKSLNRQNELLKTFVKFTNRLQDGGEVSLSEFKELLSKYNTNESILIDDNTSEVKLITNNNTEFYSNLEKINTTVVIEKSRKDEINTLIKRNKFKNLLILIFMFFSVFYFGYLLYLKYVL